MTTERRNSVVAFPSGKLLAAIVADDAFFFPGTRDTFIYHSDTDQLPLIERIARDEFAITVYNNPDTGVSSSIGTLGQLEELTPSEDDSPYRLKLFFLTRVRITDFSRVPYAKGDGHITEIAWEAIQDKPISQSDWTSQETKSNLDFIRKSLNFLIDKMPDAIEHTLLNILRLGSQERDQAGAEALLRDVLSAKEQFKSPRRELLGSLLDQTANVFSECYRLLCKAKPSRQGVKLFSNAFHTITVEERLRRVKKLGEWFLENFDDILDEEEADESEDKTAEETPGGGEKLSPHLAALWKRYKQVKAHMPEETQQELEQEFERLLRKPSNETAIETRLSWIVNMPWGEYAPPPADIREAEKILNQDHFGLAKVKERILEYLAIWILNPGASQRGILCFVGPPGVGKTSLGESIARALGRPFVSLALGGIDDVSDLRGHHYTYSNSAPGFPIQLIHRSKKTNPVFMLDEIDKVGKNWRGDPAAALLEILDPRQNVNFRDHYLSVPFDLSKVLFIATANILATIHPTLRDRLEIIEIPGYTPQEKLEIAKRHLIPRIKKEAGFPVSIPDEPPIDILFTDETILELIHNYTDEAGVRKIERVLEAPFRKLARRVLSQSPDTRGLITITPEVLPEHCGKPIIQEERFPDILEAGTVPVLATSETGGHVYLAEVTVSHYPDKRKLLVTGVRESGESKDAINKIDESLQNAFDALASRGRILFKRVQELEKESGPLLIKCNITNGSVPKDGPSAGLSLFLAVYGALKGKSIKPTKNTPLIAATGEIKASLSEVGAIGGLRDKILAAQRRGIQRCFIPKLNQRDVEDIPEEIRSKVEIIPVKSRWEALMTVYPEDREEIEQFLNTQRGS